MSDNPRNHILLFVLIMAASIFLVSTVVTAGLAGLLLMLGDAVAGRVVGWVAATFGALLAVTLILMILSTAIIQYFSEIGQNSEDDS